MIAGLAIALVIGAIAFLLARRELRLYRKQQEQPGNDDVFVYSRWRLARRLTGIAVLAGTAFTLAAWELSPPSTATGLSAFVTLLMCEIAALLLLAVVDLVETTKTARVGKLPAGVAKAVAAMSRDDESDTEKSDARRGSAGRANKSSGKKPKAGRARRKRNRSGRPR